MLKPLFPEVKYFLRNRSQIDCNEYLALFNNTDSQTVLGEKATSYIESPETAFKIKTNFPEAKIIICLRDPVERALSNYFFSYNHGVETRSIEEVFLKQSPSPKIDLNNFSANPFSYVERGLYSKYLPFYTTVFPPEQILITFMEDFTLDVTELSKVFNYLGASEPLSEISKLPINESLRSPKISNRIISKLKKYYIEDTKNLIKTYNLNIPYAYT